MLSEWILPAAYRNTTGKTLGGEMDLVVNDNVGLFNESGCWTGVEDSSLGWNKFSPIRSLLIFLKYKI